MKQRINFYDQIARNKRKSIFLIIIIVLVFLGLGYVIALATSPGDIFFFLIIASLISIIYVTISFYNSDKIALASVNAKPALKEKYRQYYHLVEGLTLASGLPMPKLYIMQDSNINAFATGRDPKHSVICVTTGALEKLDKQELEGVLAHELSHIANYDIRFMTLTVVLVGMIAIISQIFLRSLWFRGSGGGNRDNKAQIVFLLIGIVLAILAPIFVQLVQFSISRKREYTADASAVKFIRSPTGLKKALIKIKNEHFTEEKNTKENKKINKAIAPLFISDPFKKKISELSSTHPSLEKRIAVLEGM